VVYKDKNLGMTPTVAALPLLQRRKLIVNLDDKYVTSVSLLLPLVASVMPELHVHEQIAHIIIQSPSRQRLVMWTTY
jgi:hypothetical protein